MKDCFWSIYNSIDDTRVDGLRTVQLRSLMRTIAKGSLEEWLVWEEGTNDWRRASEILPLFEGVSTEALKSETQTKTDKLEPQPEPQSPPQSPSMLFHETQQE
ncbi:MAG: hypothetical protein V4760_05320, partial [Bdellovibrionota bacterium]